MPRSFISRIARDRFVTATTGTVSAAPHAALATVALTPTARSLGTITACAPNASALRRQAPRLCGSVTPSSTSSSGGVVAGFEDVVQRHVRQRIVDDGHHALVAPVAGQRVEPRGVDRMNRTRRRFGARDEIADARVLPAREHIEIVHGIRPLAQAGGDGVESEQGAGGGHRKASRPGGPPVQRPRNHVVV